MAEPLVTAEDVEERLLNRTFTDDEKLVINHWIGDLLAEIRLSIVDLDKLAEDADYLATLKRVIYASVKRVLDNPRGLRQMSISIDDYTRSETIDSTASAGVLYLTDAEWSQLVPSLDGDVFSIRIMPAPGPGPAGGSWISMTY